MRACIYLTFSSTALLLYKRNPIRELTKEDIWPLIVRCLASTSSLFIVIVAIKLVPLTIFTVITNMTPFMSFLLAWIWLGDRLGLFQIVMMIFCFAGVVLVACVKNTDEDNDIRKFGSYEIGIALTCALCLIFAVSAVSTARLKTMHFSVLQFYLALNTLLSSGIWLICCLAFDQEVFSFVGAVPWIEIIGGSLCDFFSQMLLIFMIYSMNPAMVGMFSYVKVFYCFLSDIFIFNMTLSAL